MVTGFFEGLSLAAEAFGFPDGFVPWAKSFIKGSLPNQIDALLEEIIQSYPIDSEENKLLRDVSLAHRMEFLKAVADES